MEACYARGISGFVLRKEAQVLVKIVESTIEQRYRLVHQVTGRWPWLSQAQERPERRAEENETAKNFGLHPQEYGAQWSAKASGARDSVDRCRQRTLKSVDRCTAQAA